MSAVVIGKAVGKGFQFIMSIGVGLAAADALEKYGTQVYRWGQKKIKKAKSRRRW